MNNTYNISHLFRKGFLLTILLLFGSTSLFAQTADDRLLQQILDREIEVTTSEQKEVLTNHLNEVNAVPGIVQYSPRAAGQIMVADTFMFEDFTDGIPGDWDLQDLSGAGLMWMVDSKARTFPAGEGDFNTGEYAIADSDDAGIGNYVYTSMTTSAIDISSTDVVGIDVIHDYNHLGSSSASIEISGDGDDWMEVAFFDADARNQLATIPVPTSISEGDDLYVRFTYDDGDDWNWWWAIDEITVYEPADPVPAVTFSPETFDFGNVFLQGGGVIEATFSNSGFGELDVDIAPPAEISADVASFNLGTGETQTVVMTFDPVEDGTYEETATITTNIPGFETIEVDVTAEVEEAATTSLLVQNFNDTPTGSIPDNWSSFRFNVSAEDGFGDDPAEEQRLTANIWSFAPDGWVQTPFVDLETDPFAEFRYRVVDWSGYPSTATPAGNFEATVYITTDFGASFEELYVIHENHVESLDYALVEFDMSDYENETVALYIEVDHVAGDFFFDFDTFFAGSAVGPIAELDPESLDFDEVAVDFTEELTFSITNTGTENLAVTSVSSDNAAFSTDFTQAELISPDQSLDVTVTFAPDAAGTFDGNIVVESNDEFEPVQNVEVTGVGVLPSEIATDPDALEASLEVDAEGAGETETQQLTILNEGDGDLQFSFPAFTGERTADNTIRFTQDILSGVQTSRIAGEISDENITAALDRRTYQQYVDGELTHVGARQQASIDRIEAQREISSPVMLMEDPDFIIEVDALDFGGGEFMQAVTGLTGELTSVSGMLEMLSAEGLTWTNDFAVLVTDGPDLNDSELLLQVGGLTDFGAAQNLSWVGGGSATTPIDEVVELDTPIEFEEDYYVWIGNGWDNAGAGGVWDGEVGLFGVTDFQANFLSSVEPAMGTIAPGESMTVDVTFDSNDLIGGTYTDDLVINSNDPVNPTIEVPTTLNVSGVPVLAVDTDLLDFGTLFVGETEEDAVVVTNTGTDVLTISFFNTDRDAYVVETEVVEIEVGESYNLEILFAPLLPREKNGTLFIYSDGPESPVFVQLRGEGINPGILAFSPEDIELNVELGENGFFTFEIINEGAAEFDYSLGGSLVDGSARFLSPEGTVTEIETVEPTGRSAEGENFVSVQDADMSTDLEPIEGIIPFVSRSITNEEVVLTHSLSDEIEEFNGVSCPQGDNFFLRTYTLSDFDINDDFEVTAVQFGIEELNAERPMVANIYTLDGAMQYANMTFVSSSTTLIATPADAGTILTIPVEAEIEAGSTIVVEIEVPEVPGANFFPGGNSAGATAPTYLVGPGCAIDEPTVPGTIDPDFDDMNTILNVVGIVDDSIFVFEPSEGTVGAGESVQITAEALTEEFELGTYNAEVVINTSSVATPVGVIPVEINVSETITTGVQLVHNAADPAAAMVDVYVNGDLAVPEFEFQTATPFVDLPAGVELTLDVVPSGADLAESVYTAEVMLEEGVNYTVLASGVLDPGAFTPNPDGVDTAFDLDIIEGTLTSASDESEFEFLIYHGSTDAPAVDVVAREVGPLVQGAAFRDNTDYFGVMADSYLLDVFVSGTDEPAFTFLAELTGLEGRAAAVVASGFLNPAGNQDGAPLTLLAVLDDGTVAELQNVTSVDPTDGDVPTEFALEQNYPNPFNPTTNITYALPEASEVRLDVYNIQGQRVATLVNEQQNAGTHTIAFVASRLASGVYLYRLQAGSFVDVQKMTLVK